MTPTRESPPLRQQVCAAISTCRGALPRGARRRLRAESRGLSDREPPACRMRGRSVPAQSSGGRGQVAQQGQHAVERPCCAPLRALARRRSSICALRTACIRNSSMQHAREFRRRSAELPTARGHCGTRGWCFLAAMPVFVFLVLPLGRSRLERIVFPSLV